MRYNKVNGFHIGIPSNATNIDKYLMSMSSPFVAKAVDNSSSLVKAEELIRNGKVGYSIYRISQGFPITGNDVPRYGYPIEEEADRIWNYAVSKFPPELDKSITWIELLNEVDKNESAWLNELCIALSNRALRDSYKLILLGWSSGEPEPENWFLFRDYLTLISQHHDQLAISLHEYSYTIDSILESYPYLVGRFKFLHDACDSMNTERPTIFITEWGWTYRESPDLQTMLQHIELVGNIYNHDNIKGCSIWALDSGPNWGNLNKQITELVWLNSYSPLQRVINDNPLDDPIDPNPPITETFDEFLVRVAEENRKINFNADAAIEKVIYNDGLWVYSNEKWTTYDNTQYATQGAYDSTNDEYYTYYAEVDKWDSVVRIKEDR